MIRRVILVFWCLCSSVKAQTTGSDIIRPTPALQLNLKSTDAAIPLKVNKDSKIMFSTTGINNELSEDGVMKPTPVLLNIKSTDALSPLPKQDVPITKIMTTALIEDNLLLSPSPVINVPVIMETNAEDSEVRIKPDSPVITKFETTDAAIPMANKDVLIIDELITRPVDGNLMVSPTSVINSPVIMETNADNPLFPNKVESPQLSTAAAENGLPVPVNRSIETEPLEKPITLALINDGTPNTTTVSLIEPSQVLDLKDEVESGLSSSMPTPNLEQQEPTQVPSVEPMNPLPQSVIDPCACSYYEEVTPEPAQESPSHQMGNAQPPPKQLFTPETLKMSVSRRYPPHIIFQHIVSQQFNFFVNNFPVLQVNPPPFFY